MQMCICARIHLYVFMSAKAVGRFDVSALTERFVISAFFFYVSQNIFQAVGFPFPIIACHK